MGQASSQNTPLFFDNLDAALVKNAKEDLEKNEGKRDFFSAVAFFFYDGGTDDQKLPFSFNAICGRCGIIAEWTAQKIFKGLEPQTKSNVLRTLGLNPKKHPLA